VSAVDAWFRWLEDDSLDRPTLADALTWTADEHDAARAGTAGHELLEHATDGLALEHGSVWKAEDEFGEFHLRVELDGTVHVPPIREHFVSRIFDTSIGPVQVRGRVDGTDGFEVVDYKFTGWPDPERFAESWQWRIYLALTGATSFRWEVFTLRQPLKHETAWRVTAHQTFKQYGYPELFADVERAVSDAAAGIDRWAPTYWTRRLHEAA
jgi:hypothetical protein